MKASTRLLILLAIVASGAGILYLRSQFGDALVSQLNGIIDTKAGWIAPFDCHIAVYRVQQIRELVNWI